MPDKVLMPLPNDGSDKSNSDVQSLPPSIRHEFETRFGQDFSDVRIHQNHQPTLLGASAYAQGNDIYFAPNKYQPFTEAGNAAIGHELAHVQQQRQLRNKEVPKGMVEVDKTENNRE
jgi:hypothetical protein